ncbi:ABC transporter permease [Nocardioides stalactiti]|uniref:ABC transporter permease n=1 Tax=Nocardioides stalactiti TaxID=2755356 RepID=UPI0028B1239A|nr:ABC transporter permease [Nocardioides stalactiti]
MGKHAGERSRRRQPPPTPLPPAPVPVTVPVPAPEREIAPVLVPVGAPPEALAPAATPRGDPQRERRRQRRQTGRQAETPSVERVERDVSAFPLTPPTANNGLLAVFQKRYLLKLLVKREISARYQASFLGMLWSYIGPAAQFFVYWFVMGVIMQLHKNVENFGIHVFAGLVVVHFFTETFAAGTRSIVRNKAVVVKLALPREMFPVASMLVSLFHVVPQMVILLIACLAYGWTPDPVGMAALFLGLLIAMLLGTGCALMFSAANVFFRDFSNVVNILQLFVRFSVPMIYPFSFVHARFGDFSQYYLFNPLADCVLLVQRALWVGTTSDPELVAQTDLPPDLLLWGLVMAGVSLVVLGIGQLVFSRLESKIPERL